MSTLLKLHLDFLAALDHALVLQTRKPGYGSECYGTMVQQRQAWAKFHDLKTLLHDRLYAMQREEQETITDPYAAMAAAARGD